MSRTHPLLVALGLTLAAASSAQAEPYGLGVTAGLTGLGIEGRYVASDRVSLRGGFHIAHLSDSAEIDGINYDGELNLANIGAFVDFHPFRNGFHLSAGAYIGEKSANMEATQTETVVIGDIEFTNEESGVTEGKVELADFAPFLGLGYDGFVNSVHHSFNLRLGVLYTGSPSISLESRDGTLSNDPTYQRELKKEEAQAEEDASDFKLFPQLSVGYAYRF